MSVPPQQLLPVPAKGQVISLTENMIQRRQEILDNIIATVTGETACFDNVLSPLAEYDDETSGTQHMIQVLKYASPDKETQGLVEQADKLWTEHYNGQQKRIEYVRLVQAAGDRKDSLHPEAQRMLTKKLEWYEQLGYGNISDETRQKFLQTKGDISDLCAQFNRNIRLYDGGHLTFTNEQLEGLSSADFGHFTKDDNGNWRVPLDRSSRTVILRKARNAETRRIIEAEWAKRLPENVPLFRKAILLRDENARRMGYKSFAEFCLPNRMAKSTEWVEDLHENLANRMLPKGKEYFRDLVEAKRRTLDEKGESDRNISVHPWDVSYLNRILNEQDNVDYDAISEYLPFRHTVDAVLRIFSTYLQLLLEPVKSEALVGNLWHDDVTVWAVWDENGGDSSFVGYLYGDFENRENKYKHNQTVTVQPGYLRPDGSRVYPSTILMCSFSPNIVDGCKLLRHENLKTLVHELGHALHELFARTKYSKFHGYRVSPEFGEAIGTMMENFAWLKNQLHEFGCHYTFLKDEYKSAWQKRNPDREQPPKTLPDGLVDSLINSRPKSKLQMQLGQLSDSIFDLTVHNPATHEALEKLDETKYYIELEEKFTFTRMEGTFYPQAAFSHLVSGYEAGYYAYICSNVFGEELFDSNFAADPRNKKAWARFRQELLQYGGSRDETEVLEKFLGRTPNPDAFLKRIGIETE